MKRIWIAWILLFMAAGSSGRSADPKMLWREFEARYGRSWRVHLNDQGGIRALYGRSALAGNDAEHSAQMFLQDAAELLAIGRLSDLRMAGIERTDAGTDLQFRQYFSGLPVAGAEVTIHLDRHHRVLAASSSYRSGLRSGPAQIAAQDRAMQTALQFSGADSSASGRGLWIVPAAGEARPAWRFETTYSHSRRASHLVYVDAAAPFRILRIHRTSAEASGQGTIYAENPVVTPNPSIQTFQYMDGSTALSGDFVKTYNANFELAYSSTGNLEDYTTASDPNRQYHYPTSDARFAEAMAYFHMNRVHDQWRSFGFNKLNVRLPVFVNVMSRLGGGYDNAFYTRFAPFSKAGAVVMGSGSRFGNLGWDADVYYHEYGHAVLDREKPGFFESMETNYANAFHEGFSDISSAAITGNSKLGEFALRLKETNRFVGRNLQNKNRYPQDAIHPGFETTESHHTGLIIGGAWWDLQKSIGSQTAQKLLYRSLPMIPNEMTFFDVRDAMLTADAKHFAGANFAAIQEAFSRHGLGGVDPGQTGSIQVVGLKTAGLIYLNDRPLFRLRSKFKAGDLIFIFANYRGTGLTPGYNVIPEKIDVRGPANANLILYSYWDEATNGKHSGLQGALQLQIVTNPGTKKGRYTITLQPRLGGTSTLLPEKAASFEIR